MIDTIRLEVRCNTNMEQYSINDFSYGGTKKEQTNYDEAGRSLGSITEILLSWPQEMREFYTPEVKYVRYPDYRSGIVNAFTITASLPKLMWGSNVYEVHDCDFNDILGKLVIMIDKLDLPFKINKYRLKQATVRRIDYCKNFCFDGGFSVRSLSEILNKAELRLNSDYGKIQYCRGGELFRQEIKNRRYIIYDKFAEVKATYKKARPAFGERYKSPEEFYRLLEQGHDSGREFIRHELQLTSTKQIKTELKREGLPVRTTFEALFDEKIAGQLLSRYWTKLMDSLPPLNGVVSDSLMLLDVLRAIIVVGDDGGPSKSFARLGFKTAVEICGMNAVRDLYRQYFDPKNWGRCKDTLLIDINQPCLYCDELKQITDDLAQMLMEHSDTKLSPILEYLERNKIFGGTYEQN